MINYRYCYAIRLLSRSRRMGLCFTIIPEESTILVITGWRTEEFHLIVFIFKYLVESLGVVRLGLRLWVRKGLIHAFLFLLCFIIRHCCPALLCRTLFDTSRIHTSWIVITIETYVRARSVLCFFQSAEGFKFTYNEK